MKALQKGFTLIELMIVVAIIGILAAVAVPQYQDYTVRTQVAEGLSMAAELKTAVSDYYASRGKVPADNTVSGLGLQAKGNYVGNYVTSMDVNNGSILVTYGGKANANISAKKLGLLLYTNPAGGLVWICGKSSPASVLSTTSSLTSSATTISTRYLPTDCRS